MPSINATFDTCAYYGLKPGETCFAQRSCSDCLNVPVANNPEGCVLSQFGSCVSMVFYDYTLDYRMATGPNVDSGSPYNFSGGLYHQYPAVNTTYCDATDSACLECNTIAVNYTMQNNLRARTTKFCLGKANCVCVLSCALTVWALRKRSLCNYSIPSVTPDWSSRSWMTSPSIIDEKRTRSSSLRHVYWLLGVPVFILLLLVYCCIRLKCKAVDWKLGGVLLALLLILLRGRMVAVGFETRRRRLLQTRRQSPRNHLRLSGWRQLHEQLIDKEKEPAASVIDHIEPIVKVQEEQATASEEEVRVRDCSTSGILSS